MNRAVQTKQESLARYASKPPPRFALVESSAAKLVRAGDVFLNYGRALPPGLDVHVFGNWHWLRSGALNVERRLRTAGWHFFYLVPPIATSAFGIHRKHALTRAINRFLEEVNARGVNAGEITRISGRRLFGLHLARVEGSPRHVSESAYFTDQRPSAHPQRIRDRRGLFHRRSRAGAEAQGR